MDNNKTEKLMSEAANAKLVHLNQQIVFPLLQEKIEQQLAQMCEKFKTDGTVNPGSVAYISACRDILIELDSIARRGDRAGARLNLNPPS